MMGHSCQGPKSVQHLRLALELPQSVGLKGYSSQGPLWLTLLEGELRTVYSRIQLWTGLRACMSLPLHEEGTGKGRDVITGRKRQMAMVANRKWLRKTEKCFHG